MTAPTMVEIDRDEALAGDVDECQCADCGTPIGWGLFDTDEGWGAEHVAWVPMWWSGEDRFCEDCTIAIEAGELEL